MMSGNGEEGQEEEAMAVRPVPETLIRLAVPQAFDSTP